MSPMPRYSTTGEYVTVLRGRHGSRYQVAAKTATGIRHIGLRASSTDDARTECAELFGPDVPVWVPSAGEPLPDSPRRLTLINTLEATMHTHDYEPGTGKHPMHTDPACAACGKPKNDRSHDTDPGLDEPTVEVTVTYRYPVDPPMLVDTFGRERLLVREVIVTVTDHDLDESVDARTAKKDGTPNAASSWRNHLVPHTVTYPWRKDALRREVDRQLGAQLGTVCQNRWPS